MDHPIYRVWGCNSISQLTLWAPYCGQSEKSQPWHCHFWMFAFIAWPHTVYTPKIDPLCVFPKLYIKHNHTPDNTTRTRWQWQSSVPFCRSVQRPCRCIAPGSWRPPGWLCMKPGRWRQRRPRPGPWSCWWCPLDSQWGQSCWRQFPTAATLTSQ